MVGRIFSYVCSPLLATLQLHVFFSLNFSCFGLRDFCSLQDGKYEVQLYDIDAEAALREQEDWLSHSQWIAVDTCWTSVFLKVWFDFSKVLFQVQILGERFGARDDGIFLLNEELFVTPGSLNHRVDGNHYITS